MRHPDVIARGAAALGVIGVSAVLAAQAPAPQAPVFRSGADVVEVDVQVIDRDGRPIAALEPGEFSLLVDDKPRPVSAVSFVTYDAGTPAASPAPADAETRALTAASFSSNREAPPGRLFVLAVDQGNMTRGGGRGAMEAAGRFLDQLSPADRAALVTLPVGPVVDFTSNHALVKAAAAKVVGGGANRYDGSYLRGLSLAEAFAFVSGSRQRLFEEAVSQECRFVRSPGCRSDLESDARSKVMAAHAARQATVQSLRALFDRLTAIEGPKFVVFIGQALVTGSSFGDLRMLVDFDWVAARAQAARVSLYVLQFGSNFLQALDVSEPRLSRTLLEDSGLLDDGLSELAGAAGGGLFRLMVKLDPAFERIARETAAGYVLRFDVAAADRDGKAHDIAVRVNRPGVTVRARKSFVASAPEPAGAGSTDRQLGLALRAPLVSQALSVELTTTVIREPAAPTGRLLIAADMGCGPQAPAAADVALALTGSDGVTRTLPAERTTAVVPRGDEECLYYSTTVRVPPGDGTLRLAVVSADGRSGAVDRPIAFGVAAGGGLRLGHLLLTDPQTHVAGKMKLIVDGTVRDRLAAYIEADALGPAPPSAPQVTFEVAAGARSPALTTESLAMTQDEPGKWYAEATVDLRQVPPGRYVLRAIVSTNGAEAVRTGRLLRIVR